MASGSAPAPAACNARDPRWFRQTTHRSGLDAPTQVARLRDTTRLQLWEAPCATVVHHVVREQGGSHQKQSAVRTARAWKLSSHHLKNHGHKKAQKAICEFCAFCGYFFF